MALESHHDDLSGPGTRAATQAMARNLIEWMEVSVHSYGIQTFHIPGLWWRQPGASGIYLAAVILGDQTPDELILAEM